MYAVVGCRECRALWIVEGRPDTTRCPRCGTRRQFSKLRRFLETGDADEARQARSALLAKRQDESEAFADLDPFGALETRADEAGMDDGEYLERAGVDSESVAAAGERAERGPGSATSDRLGTVRAALADLDSPTADDVVTYAAERGVEESFAREALDRLVRRGEATENRGEYRKL
jgi:hypothetical protein